MQASLLLLILGFSFPVLQIPLIILQNLVLFVCITEFGFDDKTSNLILTNFFPSQILSDKFKFDCILS